MEPIGSLQANARAPQDPWCEIRLGGHVTRYRRIGSGRALVLLADEASDALWPGALEVIAAKHRVYAPEVPARPVHTGPWLRTFLDGVGAEHPAMIASGDHCVPALEYALLEPDRVNRLVLVPDGEAEVSGLEGSLGAPERSTTLPILLLRREHPVGSAVEQLSTFLERPAPR